jgi:molybdate transport system ATP-binding protein
MLEFDLTLGLGSLRLDLRLSAAAGQVMAILGPNGSGKTTLLRALAGLIPIDRGRISLNDRVLDDTSRSIRVPTEARRTAMVFQDYLLFPHLTALDNVAFGLMATATPARAARMRARSWLERLDLGGVEDLRPHQLSGGQAQRVALARALVTEPELLMLDEPLAALDTATRHQTRHGLAASLRELRIPTLLVTHDPLEAAVLGQRLVILEEGRVVQEGSMAEIARRPRSSFTGRLVGTNLLRGEADGHQVRIGKMSLIVAEPMAGEVFVVIRPSAVALHRRQPDGSPRNVWQAAVSSLERVGDRVRVGLGGPVDIVAEVTPGALNDLGLGEPRPLWVSVKATEIDVYPA